VYVYIYIYIHKYTDVKNLLWSIEDRHRSGLIGDYMCIYIYVYVYIYTNAKNLLQSIEDRHRCGLIGDSCVYIYVYVNVYIYIYKCKEFVTIYWRQTQKWTNRWFMCIYVSVCVCVCIYIQMQRICYNLLKTDTEVD
jgi:hypothetical protein